VNKAEGLSETNWFPDSENLSLPESFILEVNKAFGGLNKVGELVLEGQRLLGMNQEKLSFNEPALEAKILAESAFCLSSTERLTKQDMVVSDAQKNRFLSSLCQRIEGKPIAYITGEQPFWTLSLATSPETLIPRSDTETLVETALELEIPQNASVLDLGTGTGAIALALKSERASWEVIGADFKDNIVALAQKNAKRNSLDVNFVKSDWFSAFYEHTSNASLNKSFDLIVSNPPYVEQDSAYLTTGDLLFEPNSALTSGLDGLDDIRHIILNAPSHLNPEGYLMIEHGFEQSKTIQDLLREAGFKHCRTIQDINKLDRVTLGQIAMSE
jgi:release factor glutamine methyltransferase